ncbi:dynein heavy chain 9, axonemal isoform X2 [Pungitius pungitius]|uniref:dynein heavy chain 9, axonemal isoform X2 n=1 Tax=Pungitius pungitius TaxID=134920 RepID=UPI002E0F48FE
MDARDKRLDPVSNFTLTGFGLEQEPWREFASGEESRVILNSFFNTQDYTHLFIHHDDGGQLHIGLDYPQNVQTKVIYISKTGQEVVTKENGQNILIIQEVQGGDAKTFTIAACEEVTFPLLSNPGTSRSSAVGLAEEALRFMERQRNEALAIKAQIEGRTFLPYSDAFRDKRFHDNALHDDSYQGDTEGRKWLELLHVCDSTIIEWVKLVSEVLQQDSSQMVLDGLEPLPSAEFNFWRSRLRNLHFIQQQLKSSRAQQVLSIAQRAESVYLSSLRDLHTDVQKGLDEAEDITRNLTPVQEKLEELQQMEYQQLGDNMAAVMEEVRLVWIRSVFYCRPCRVVVLLQEICTLLIQMVRHTGRLTHTQTHRHTHHMLSMPPSPPLLQSRSFLLGEDLMRPLGSEPGEKMDDITLVIWTLKSLKEAFRLCRTQLEDHRRDGDTLSWDFPSQLVFFRLDHFLLHLQGIQEVFRVSLQLHQLECTVLSGVGGRMWTDVVQEVYQDFLCHVTVMCDLTCDPTDPDDQSFLKHLSQFWVQVSDLERRLVSVLSRAFEDCCVSSSAAAAAAAAKLVKMFGFILDRPLIHDQLRPHLVRLEEMVLEELDQIELLFFSQREESDTFCMFTPSHAARLCWSQQLRLRAETTLKHLRTLQQLDLDSGASKLVLQRFNHIEDLLRDFGDGLRSSWSSLLDSDSEFILEQPVIQNNQQGMLVVNCSNKLQVVLRELRYVSRKTAVELRPYAARLFTCRDDITRSYLSLSHMVSCYNQVVSGVFPAELSLIQDQLQDLHLNQNLSDLQRYTWGSEGLQQQVEQNRDAVLLLHSTVSQARANMDAMTRIIQGWAELDLLQRSGESLLEVGDMEQSYRHIREEGEELLRLTQLNRSLYGAEDSSKSWVMYLDHLDDKVQDGLFQLVLRSLHFLLDNMKPQSCCAFVTVSLQLQETGSVFEPSVGVGLSDLLQTIISDIYTAASLPLRISVSRHSNYQVSLQQSSDLSALEQEVKNCLLQVKEEAELLLTRLDRYSYLWLSDRKRVMQEFLTYSRQLGPEELEAVKTPPTLTDFQREINSLNTLREEVTHLDDVILLHSWLQVDQRAFRDSLLSLVHKWRHLYTDYLLDSVSDSLQQVTPHCDDDVESASSSSFRLSETIILLEAAGVQLPDHLSAQLQC